MIYINLIPEGSIQRSYNSLIRGAIVGCIAAILGYAGPYWYAGVLQGQAQEIQTRTAEKQQTLQKLQVDINKTKQLQTSIDAIKAKQNSIRMLGRLRKQPVYVLDKFQSLHPDRLWIDSLSVSGNKISITGCATDFNVISDYLRRLKGVNGEEIELDPHAFQPELRVKTSNSAGYESPEIQTIAPVSFSDVVLKGAKLEACGEGLLQRFSIDFSTNIETSL